VQACQQYTLLISCLHMKAVSPVAVQQPDPSQLEICCRLNSRHHLNLPNSSNGCDPTSAVLWSMVVTLHLHQQVAHLS
jgi:hypothetical protein